MVAVPNEVIGNAYKSVVKIEDIAGWLSERDPDRIPVLYATALVRGWISFMHYVVLERIKENQGFLKELRSHHGYIELDGNLTPMDRRGDKMAEALTSAAGLPRARVMALLGVLFNIFDDLARHRQQFEPLGVLLHHHHALQIRLSDNLLAPTTQEEPLVLPEEYVTEDEEDMDNHGGY